MRIKLKQSGLNSGTSEIGVIEAPEPYRGQVFIFNGVHYLVESFVEFNTPVNGIDCVAFVHPI